MAMKYERTNATINNSLVNAMVAIKTYGGYINDHNHDNKIVPIERVLGVCELANGDIGLLLSVDCYYSINGVYVDDIGKAHVSTSSISGTVHCNEMANREDVIRFNNSIFTTSLRIIRVLYVDGRLIEVDPDIETFDIDEDLFNLDKEDATEEKEKNKMKTYFKDMFNVIKRRIKNAKEDLIEGFKEGFNDTSKVSIKKLSLFVNNIKETYYFDKKVITSFNNGVTIALLVLTIVETIHYGGLKERKKKMPSYNFFESLLFNILTILGLCVVSIKRKDEDNEDHNFLILCCDKLESGFRWCVELIHDFNEFRKNR